MTRADLDPRIHQAARLGIMTLLYRNRSARFTWIRNELGLTDGNLQSHAARLSDEGLIHTGRQLSRDGFHVRLSLTEQGEQAYLAYLSALRRLLDDEGSDGRTL